MSTTKPGLWQTQRVAMEERDRLRKAFVDRIEAASVATRLMHGSAGASVRDYFGRVRTKRTKVIYVGSNVLSSYEREPANEIGGYVTLSSVLMISSGTQRPSQYRNDYTTTPVLLAPFLDPDAVAVIDDD